MIKSIDDIVMVGAFPIDKYNKEKLDALTSVELSEIISADDSCGVYDIFEIVDMTNDDNIDRENYHFVIL